jgi:lipoate-protein ligase B
MPDRPGWLLPLGRVGYGDGWDLQKRLVAARRAGRIPDTLLLLEHPPTYTVGRSGTLTSILFDGPARARAGIELYEVDRGGDATYHGPGQVVGYPIVDLRPRGNDVHAYLRDLEEILLRTLAEYGLAGKRDGHYTGVWIDGAKVAAIGVKVSGGIASHGFALNVAPDFAHWAGIVACGIRNREVTALARLLDRPPDSATVGAALARHAAAVFGLDWQTVDLDALSTVEALGRVEAPATGAPARSGSRR